MDKIGFVNLWSHLFLPNLILDIPQSLEMFERKCDSEKKRKLLFSEGNLKRKFQHKEKSRRKKKNSSFFKAI